MSNEYEGDYPCEMSEDSRCRKPATQVWREPYTPRSFRVYVCDEHADHCRGFGYKRDLEAEEQLEADKAREREAWRLLEANPCTDLAPVRFCMECRKPTTGSIGQAGYYWHRLCQSCKDRADGILRNDIRTQATLMRAMGF